ncbi:hypothetical protein CNMCM5623_004092 [Aspergillus felis]|uniref:Polyketide synthase n=1 Tax=Aspergillus felis TaxID=1287682 RepID=A0A8H6PRE0_9EURO|nr:hypothetical protein CNMCM5623_004092 [Aspergillus felis]
MANHLELFLFGDQTYNPQPCLREMMRNRHNPALENFLSKSYDAIRAEIYSLPHEVRANMPRFTCLDDLILWKQDGQQCIPLDMALTCMYQLGAFISKTEGGRYPAQDSAVLGICTGALAAVAVSCSRSTLELIPIAVDTVVIAFRTGKLVADITRTLEPLHAPVQSWSIFIRGLTSAEAVRKFREQTVLPLTRQPYISAVTPNGITVSGPPSSLTQMTSSSTFKDFRLESINIYGPYHATHLYSQNDVEAIVGSLAPRGSDARRQMLLLSSTETPVRAGGLDALWRAAIEQILLQPICWNSIFGQLQAMHQKVSPKTLRITPIGTKADQLIYTALRQTPLCNSLSMPEKSPKAEPQTPYSNPGKPKLAIVGMSGRFPGANDIDAFWDLLYQGLDVHKPVPALHWDAKTHVDPTGAQKNTSSTPFGCWLDDPASFDARFFNISPREAPQIDPAQRLALMTAYEAIEQAGIVPDATPSTRRDRVGVFYGVTSNDWMETNSAQDIDTYFIPGGNRAFIPGRINYYFKFSGPSFAVDTACSSSLAGIHLACNALWQGDIDTAIAGGTNILTNPDFTAGLDRGHFLSRTGNCKTFDDSADGYCRGEGVGTVIIKRLDDAVADHDPILGVILGAYTNHSAESESITRPHAGAQCAVFRRILNQSMVDPYAVSYVEMHGTGTQTGDAGEMSSVLDTFAPPANQVKKYRSKDEALFLGSAKANIGHGEAVSGVSSLVKVLLMMQKNTIVPHCGIKTRINHKFPTDLQQRNVHIASEPTPWMRSKPRLAFVNNFSAAGGNTALLLEDAPNKQEPCSQTADSRSHHLIAMSAKNSVSLQGNLRSIHRFLQENPGVSLSKLSYTTTARRIHHQHRVMLLGSHVDELGAQIEAALRDQTGTTRPKSAPKIVFAFTGQGAQYPGMGKELFENFSRFRNRIRRLDQIGQSLGFPSMLQVILSDAEDIGRFAPTAVQLASVCLQIALSELWASWNIMPVAVVGHSLGEYAALNVAGALSDADTVYLVGKRAELLQSQCTRDTHAMLVVKGSKDEVTAVLKNQTYEIACINSPVETVVAGRKEDISRVRTLLANAGLKSTLLSVPYAFHSSQIEPVLADFRRLASGVTYSTPKLPVLCPLDGSVVHSQGRFGPDYLARHTREPVNMLQALLAAQSQRIITDQTTTLEIGPHPAVSGMVKAVLGPQVPCLASLQRARPVWQVLGATLKTLYTAGADIHWAQYHADFHASHEVITLPAYCWDLKPYWIQYTNDWSLRKGDPPLTRASSAPKLESTTIHKVLEETSDAQKGRIVVEANIARPDLSPLVQGHEVDGVPLCTPSVYADIALSLGTYLREQYRPSLGLVDVSEMTISKPLILKAGATQQLLQAHADVDWTSSAAAIEFMSFDANQKLQGHARCVVRFKDRDLLDRLQREAADVKQKIQGLRQGIVSGATARFNRPMVYRAIRPLARFHNDYRAIDEIVLNSHTLEASSLLSFDTVKRGGSFHTHPAIIDALTQSCGFAMNCNDNTDLDVEVFMNHGWGSFQLFEPVDFEKKYTTYTRMVEGADKLWHGDVVIFDGDRPIGYFGQLAIQGVPRRILKVILSLESGKSTEKSQRAGRKPGAPSLSLRNDSAHSSQAESKIGQAMSIIAEESGLAVSDLNDSTVFADVGIDSLLSLTITARFKEELDVDMEFSTFFFDYPTVSDLKGFFGELQPDSSVSSLPSSVETLPTLRSSATTPTTDDDFLPKEVNFLRALQIISEESGVAVEGLTDDTDLAASGVDSLLSLVIISRFRDELDLDIQHESLFLECPTVGDLRQLLVGETTNETIPPPESAPLPPPEPLKCSPSQTGRDLATTTERLRAVDSFVQKYTAGFTMPAPAVGLTPSSDGTRTILVTGASGSLGSHLVYHLAQLPDVRTVVCLNRKTSEEPYTRQYHAMREKGIRFPDALKSKLLVLQTDSSQPYLGLSRSEYEGLVSSVTHLIHNAWPMSAKRPLVGFEPQFQVMRNLIDFACAVVARRPHGFKFSFQMVSSIGVVGNYGLSQKNKTTVPEERMGIDAVLPNGYGEAKWGCERMLDETLHRYPDLFRVMAVRLGQIAGSKTSGYWNPMEHFGFLIKSSQTLNALPDVPGTVYWTPVNDVAGTLADLVLSDRSPYPVYHVENPVGQPWRETNAILADALNIQTLIPFEEWVQRVREAPMRNNPAATLLEFLDSNYLRMSCGGLVLDTRKTLEHSKTLAAVGKVSEEVVRKYIHIWKEIGFLN